jgi:hypothetical protein
VSTRPAPRWSAWILLALVLPAPACDVAARSLPSRLGDKAFWQLVESFSEPNGYFRSDNFLSNETAYQTVIPELQAKLPAGGVYIGVGPEQNFTYVVALRPKLAFIVDIRRQNMVEHLLYKAFIELSSDRRDFLSRLFARPRPPDLDPGATSAALFDAYRAATPSEELFQQNLQEARDRLVTHHKFPLTPSDVSGLEYVYNAFYRGGPDLNYSFSGFPFGGGFRFPTYAALMAETDGRGGHRSYLATEQQFRILKEMEKDNAIIPITGDFAGPKALRSIGRYLKSRDATVTAFYTSNVEQYLFQQTDAWRRFLENVAALPVDARSTFIRSVSTRGFMAQGGGTRLRAQTRLSSIADLLQAYDRGAINTYSDVVAFSR